MRTHLFAALAALVPIIGCGKSDVAGPRETQIPSLVAATAGPTITDLGTLGGRTSFGHDINDNGVVVGQSDVPGQPSRFHAFRWDRTSGMVDLGTLPGTLPGLDFSTAIAINRLGFIVGYSYDAAGDQHAVMWDPSGNITDLGFPPGTFVMTATNINDNNEIVGEIIHSQGNKVFKWTQQTGVVDLNLPFDELYPTGFNNRGAVAGAVYGGSSENAGWFLVRPREGFRDLGAPLGYNAYAFDMNESGQIVGYDQRDPFPNGNSPSYSLGAFSWTPKGGFKYLGGTSSIASGVNDLGEIVGNSSGQAFFYRPNVGMAPLPGLAGLSGNAVRLNLEGQAVGYSLAANGKTHGVIWDGIRLAKPDSVPGSGLVAVTAVSPMDCLRRRDIREPQSLPACMRGEVARGVLEN